MKAILYTICAFFWLAYGSLSAKETIDANACDFNIPPVAIFSMTPSSGDYPLTVSFNGSASYDPDGPFINHFWTFGDGNIGSGATATHTYTTAGTFTAHLLVTDIYGAAHSISKTITVTAPDGIYTIGVEPIEDVFIQVGTRQNISTVEVSPTKKAYLKFDLSGIIGNVIDANLRLSYEGLLPRTGRVTVWEGSHNSWSETGITEASAPFPVQVVGERDSLFEYSYYDWDISGVEAGNTYSYILLSDNENFAFGSTEFYFDDGHPQLFLTVDNSSPSIIPPTVSITSPGNDAIIPPATNILIEASASDANGTIAKVDFYRGNILLGTDNTAPYTHTITGTLADEEYNVKAIATDNDGFTTSSEMIHIEIGDNQAPIVLITAPSNEGSYATGDEVTIVVSASDSDGYITKVEFYDGNVKLGQDNTFPYEYTISNLSVGPHDFTALAYDSNGASVVSSTVTINVNNLCGIDAVADLDFDSNSGSGLVAQNGGGTNGILQGDATKVAASTGGNVLLLSSSGDYVSVPHYADIGFTDNITLSGWVNVNEYIGDAGIIVKGSTARAYGLRITSDGRLNFNVPNGGSWSSNGTLNLRQWYHVAATYDGSNVRFYIDGVLDPNQPAAIINFPNNTEPLTVGADLVNTNKYFDGLIDEAGVYCRALSGGEIVTLASETAPNILPELNVTMPADGDSYFSGDDIVIQADASDLDGTITKVEFFVNGVKIGEDTSAPYEYTYSTPPVGDYDIITRAFDNMGSVATINDITVLVEAPDILMEAECANVGSEIGTRSIGSASNGAYVLYPGVGKTFLSAPADPDNHIIFRFIPAVIGTYEVHVRVQANSSNNDSFWVRINGGSWILFENFQKSLGFIWVKLFDNNDGGNTVVRYLTQDINVIEFAAREDGTKLDKIAIVTAGTPLPTGVGAAAMNCNAPLPIDGDELEARNSMPDAPTELTVYPNPFHSVLHVTIPATITTGTVQLVDAKGQILASKPINEEIAEVQFQNQTSPSGMYFVRLITNDTTVTKRVMHIQY